MRKRSRLRTFLAVLFAFALVAAACGDDDDVAVQGPPETVVVTSIVEIEVPGPTVTVEVPGETVTVVETMDREPVKVMASWGGDEQAGFLQVLNAFTAATGLPWVYESQRDLVTVLTTRIAGGNAPDLAMIPRPGFLASFVDDGVVVPLTDILDQDALANYGAGALGFGTVDDTLYGLLAKANSKSTFWYKPASFTELGVEVPETWTELLAIVDAYVAAGKTPLSIGGLDGWTLTDWFENIYIRVAGPEAYDQLFVTGEVKWTDATVVEAMERFAEIISPTSAKLAGGAGGTLSTGFIDAFDIVLNGDAEMYYEGGFMGSFAAQNFPDLVAGEDYAFFTFPEINPEFGKPVVGGGDLAAIFNDTPEVRELMKFLASKEANEVWASADRGAVISPNTQVALDIYAPLTRLEAEGILGASVFVFDGSDLADPSVGGDAMFTALQDFIDNPDDIDGVLEFIENVAAGVR